MSIELGSTATSLKVGAGAEKGKIKSNDDAGNADRGGFSEILTSLDSPSDQSEVARKQATAEEKPKSADEASSDAVVPPTSAVPSEMAMLLAQAGEVASDKLNASLTPSTSDVPTETAMLLAQAGEMSGNKLSALSEGRLVGRAGSMRLGAHTIAADKPEVANGKSVSLGAEKADDFKQSIDALVDQSAPALLGQARKTRGAELQAAAAASLAESRALKQSSIADAMTREPVLSGAMLTSGLGDDFLRQADRAGSKSSVQTTGAGLEGIWGQQPFQAGNHVDTPSVIADASMLSPEKTVADTVSYWVTQGVQNAELKLDGFGGEPIAVSISLKGDEAHIDFRTDQPEVRQILEGAVAHLKELLSSEGLVLSGVSVGGSGQGGAGAQEQRNRPDARQTTIATPDAGTAGNLPRVNKPGGRALDLYV